jgi:GNAT superfamily N-acetyltransferase
MPTDPHLLHAIAKSLEAPDIPSRLALPDGRAFTFSIVRSDGQEELYSELAPRLGDEEWGVYEWISDSVFYPGFVVSIEREGEDRSSGFLAFDTRVFIFGTGHHDSLKISVTVEPQVVYVSPDARGQGFGRAFIDLLSGQMQHTLGLIETAMQTSLNGSCVKDISVALEAECVSDEGARFLRNALHACQVGLKDFRSHRPDDIRWCAEIDDAVDYSDWANEEEFGAVPCL